MGSAADDVRAAIEEAGGAIPFSRFMELALYGPHGFYTSAGQAGRRGDFLTSPEVGPLFGAVVARSLDAEWERLGRPEEFTVVDAGAGPGTLARSVLAARPACTPAMRYVAVEVSGAQRQLHPADVESSPTLPVAPIDGVVIANELLDNLPFRLAVHDGAWREAFVTTAPDGTFAELLSDRFDPLPPCLPPGAPLGGRAPIHDAAIAWLGAARSMVRRGRVVVIDYVRPATAEMARLPWREWLRTYRGHERGGGYLDAPGTQDITADLAADQFPEPDVVRSQAQFLQRYGIDELVEEGRQAWAAGAARADLAAMTMRSRAREADALLDPAGLGRFTVLEWECPVQARTAD